MTVVGLLPPVWDEGALLIDGGFVNNMPFEAMIDMGIDTIIGVVVEETQDRFSNLKPYSKTVSGCCIPVLSPQRVLPPVSSSRPDPACERIVDRVAADALARRT
eukprot:1906438-Rhodomonas_salina.1